MSSGQSNFQFPTIFPQVDRQALLVTQQLDRGLPEQWALNIRKHIDESIRVNGHPNNDDIINLQKKFVRVIINVLQPDCSRKDWSALLDAVRLIEPYAGYLNVNQGQALQRRHYIERLYQTCIKHPDGEDFALAIEAMKKVFPEEVSSAERKHSPALRRDIPSRSGAKTPSVRETRQKMLRKSGRILLGKHIPLKELGPATLPDGSKPFDLWKEEDSVPRPPNHLTIGNMRWALNSVAAETAAHEYSWQATTSSVVGALSMYLEEPGFQPRFTQTRFIPHVQLGPRTTEIPATETSKAPETKKEFASITGRDAVELFTSKRHLDVVEFMYFNYANTRHYRPYDLVSVPEDKANSEHYVFSSFGVLHVFGDGTPSETMTLAEWNRMAVLWNIVSKIPFFKNFLVTRSFTHWRHIVRRQRLLKIRTFLQNNLVFAIPEFAISITRILLLSKEFSELRLLPGGSSTSRNLPLAAFAFSASNQLNAVEEKIQLYFRLCIKIVNSTKQKCLNEMKQAEYQMQHEKPLFSKESMYVQRKKRKLFTTQLEKTRNAVRQLSTFVSLVSQIIYVNVQQMCRSSVNGFVYQVLAAQLTETTEDHADPSSSPTAQSKDNTVMMSQKSSYIGYPPSITSSQHNLEDSLFVTEIVFNRKTKAFEMNPATEQFSSAISDFIPTAISAVCNSAELINENVQTDGQESAINESDKDSAYSDQYSVGSSASKEEHEVTDPLLSCLEEPVGNSDREESGNLRFSLKNTHLGLAVTGDRIVGDLIPIDSTKWESKLNSDEEVVAAISVQDSILSNASQEVCEFCDEQNEWFVPISEFITQWNVESSLEWKGKPARDLETILNQVKTWSDKVKNMDRFVKSTNGLVIADCRKPKKEALSALSTIFKQLINLIISEARSLATEIVHSSKDAIKLLENKELGIKSFASYARKVTECHQMKDEMSGKVTYVRQMYEVLRMTHRQLTQEEEKIEERVKNAWEAYMFQLKDATNFASNQQPLILKQLHDLFDEKYEFIKSLVNPEALESLHDPTRSPSEVLLELKGLISSFSSTRRQLYEFSVCRNAIEGKEFDLSELEEMALVLDTRHELWKYVSISAQQIAEWKSTLFRRFDATKAMNKISDWRKALTKLTERLPTTNAVLQSWNDMISEIAVELPLLGMMANPAVKNRHWKKIFNGFGENYEAGWSFTVRDLLSYQLSQHEGFINQVCQSASAEYALELLMKKIKTKWENKQFNLAKHIQVVMTTPKQEEEATNLRKKKLKNLNFSKPVPQEIDSDTYVLVGYKDLLRDISDSHVTLQGMLQSRYVAEVRGDAEVWNDAFQQIADIIEVWTSCQDKWKYLNMVYNSGVFARSRLKFSLFTDMDRRYREFVKAIVNDPHVLSILSRRHGQQGWRELQGEVLRKHILSCIQLQEKLLANLSQLLDEFRSDFPRMYFLCDEDCIHLLSITREPKLFAPYVRKCFSGIKSLTYALPSDVTATSNNLDRKIHTHKLEVTQVQGHNSETIAFKKPITMQKEPLDWMKMLEHRLLRCLQNSLISAVSSFPNFVNSEGEDADTESTLSWVSRFPAQIILLVDSIKWSNSVDDVLREWNQDAFHSLERKVGLKIAKCSLCLRKTSTTDPKYTQSIGTLVALLSQAIYQKDTLHDLKQRSVTCITDFHWQRIIRHSVNSPVNGIPLKEVSAPKHLECTVHHFGNVLDKYGMEYESSFLDSLSSSSLGTPFVMSPLSERSIVSLCLALKMDRCGILVGAHGSGKTSVVRHMARLFGRPLVNFNLSESTEMNMILRALCGVVESQCWLCFDKAEDLRTPILSSLAQQIQNVQQLYSILRQPSVQRKVVSTDEEKLKRSDSFPSLHSAKNTANSLLYAEDWNPSTYFGVGDDIYRPVPTLVGDCVGNLVLNGKLLKATSRCGLFMTWANLKRDFPSNLKAIARSVAFIKPPFEKLAEIWLTSFGFVSAQSLSGKLQESVRFLQDMGDRDVTSGVAHYKEVTITLRDVKSIVLCAARKFDDEFKISVSQASALEAAEDACLADAVCSVLMTKLTDDLFRNKFREVLSRIFTFDEIQSDDVHHEIEEAVCHQVYIDGLSSDSAFVSRIMELYHAINRGKAVILNGPSGCGKTMIYKTLASSLKLLHGNEVSLEGDSSKVNDKTNSPGKGLDDAFDVQVIFTDVLSQDDLFGPFLNKSGVWMQGMLSKILKSNNELDDFNDANSTRKDLKFKLNKWIVLDGELNAPWIECMNCLIEASNVTRLHDLDQVSLNDSTAVIFEVSNLSTASPAVLSRCEVVNCSNTNRWNFVTDSWMDSAYSKFAVTRLMVKTWKDMVDDLVPKSLEFLRRFDSNVLNYGATYDQKMQLASSSGIAEISSFLQIFESLMTTHLSRHAAKSSDEDKGRSTAVSRVGYSQSPGSSFSVARSQREKDVPEFHQQLSNNFFAFAFIWAFGGRLLEEDMPRFDAFFRNLLTELEFEIDIPVYENVFEYFVDPESGFWTLWEDNIDSRGNAATEEMHYSSVHQIERYAYLSAILLRNESPVLLVGERGCGKTSMVTNLLSEEHVMSRVPISSGMTPRHLQKLIESRSSNLKQHNIGLMAHPNAVIDTRADKDVKCLIFLDDLSCAPNIVRDATENLAIQPVHALVRQILSSGTLYDHEHQLIQTIKGKVNFLAASCLPGAPGSGHGYSSHMLFPRLTRLFTVIHFRKPSREAILSIYHNSVQSWLEEFPAYSLSRHYDLSQAIIAGAHEIYSTVKSHFKPAPSQPTYLFSLHDIGQVMRGMFLLAPKARGRPKPIRKRMPGGRDDGNMGRLRPLAGRPTRRLGGRQYGDNAAGNSAMMRTIIRLWLHECCRTFADRMATSDHRIWVSDLVLSMLKKHFCQDPRENRADTPGSARGYSLTPPVPSGHFSQLTGSSSPYSTSINDEDVSGDNLESIENGSSLRDGAITEDNVVSLTSDDLTQSASQRDSKNTNATDTNSNAADTEVMDSESASLFIEEDDGVSEFSEFQDDETSDGELGPQSTAVKTADSDEDESVSPDTIDQESKSNRESADKRAETTTDTTQDSIPNDDRTTAMDNTVSSQSASAVQQSQSSAISLKTDDTPKPSGLAKKRPGKTKRPVHGRPGGAKHGVSFVPGLIDDPEQAAKEGPLANVYQILGPEEDPFSIVFSKCMKTDYQGNVAEYYEARHYEMESVLTKSQISYNKTYKDDLGIVFYEEAARHVARFSRVLALEERGNALCISGSKFSGRKSFCRLAAFIAKSNLIHVKSDKKNDIQQIFRSCVIRASKSAGLDNRSTTLLFDEEFSDNIDCLMNICAIVKEGSYPSLYKHSELADIASNMSSDSGFISLEASTHRPPTGDKMDRCLQLFFKRVLANLHVVVLMHYPSLQEGEFASLKEQTSDSSFFHRCHGFKSLHETFKKCPEFLTHFASVDFFQPWNQNGWLQLTETFLSNNEGVNSLPWPENVASDDYIKRICSAISRIHEDSIHRLKAVLPNSYNALIKPLTLQTTVDLFVNITLKVGSNQRKVLERFDNVLSKIRDAETEVEHLKLGKAGLIPLLQSSIENERSWKRHVEQETKEYAEAKDRCGIEEKIIETVDEELETLKMNTKIAFDKVSPLFDAAVHAMQAVSVGDIAELKSFKTPPKSAVTVATVLCEIFSVVPANWENGKNLILQDQFFEELEFYDKDNVPEPLFQLLSRRVADPNFQPHVIARGSRAAESICIWVHAIHSYAKMCRYMAPKIQKVKETKSRLRKAQITLGVKRVRCYQIKEKLDEKIQKHREAYEMAKKIGKDLEEIELKMTKAQILMGNLTEHTNLWKDTREAIQSQLNTAIGDCLLSTACLVYHAVLHQTQRVPAFSAWISICHEEGIFVNSSIEHPDDESSFQSLQFSSNRPLGQNKMHIRRDSIFNTPPDVTELRGFNPYTLFVSNRACEDLQHSWKPAEKVVYSALATLFSVSFHQSTCWPLILDPDNELKPWIKILAEAVAKEKELSEERCSDSDSEDQLDTKIGSRVIVCPSDHSELEQKLSDSLSRGHHLFITDVERAPESVMKTVREMKPGQDQYGPSKVHPNFRLFLVTTTDVKYLDSLKTTRLPLEFCACVDFSIAKDDFRHKLLKIVMSHERPDFENHRRLLRTDIAHLKLQKKSVMDRLFDKVAQSDSSLLHDSHLLEDIRTCKRETAAIAVTLTETINMKANLEKKLSELEDVVGGALALYDTLTKAYLMKSDFYCWTPSALLSVLTDIVTLRSRGKLYQPNEMSLKSRGAEIDQSMTRSVLQLLKATMFKSDYFVLTVTLSLTKLRNCAKMSEEEVESFIKDTDVRKRVPSGSDGSANDKKPTWMSGQMWRTARNLEQSHRAFAGLTHSIATKQSLWQEYLFSDPVLLMNVPEPEMSHLTIGQKALLWKVLRRETSKKIMTRLVNGVFGNASTAPFDWTVDTLLASQPRNVPIVFLTTTKGVQPLKEVQIAAEYRNVKLVQRSAPFDQGLATVLQRCMSDGHWLVLEECQIAQDWNIQLVNLITTVTQSAPRNAEISGGRGQKSKTQFEKSEDSDSKLKSQIVYEDMPQSRLELHENFRLWLVLSVESQQAQLRNCVPDVVVKRGFVLNLTSQAPLRDIASRNLELLSRAKDTDTDGRCDVSFFTTKLATSHAIFMRLLGSSNRVHPHTDIDLVGFRTICRTMREFMSDGSLTEFCEEFLRANSLSGSDVRFNQVVAALRDTRDEPSKNRFEGVITKVFGPAIDIDAMLQRRRGSGYTLSLNKDRDAIVFALNVTAKYFAKSSSSPALGSYLAESTAGVLRKLEDLLTLASGFDHFGGYEGTADRKVDFFTAEYSRVATAIALMKTDISASVEAMKGCIEMSDRHLRIIESLINDAIPQAWISNHPEVFQYHSHRTVRSFLRLLQSSSTVLRRYKYAARNFLSGNMGLELEDSRASKSTQTPTCFNLGAFVRPDLFLRYAMTAVLGDEGLQSDACFEAKIVNRFAPATFFNTPSFLIEDVWLCNATYNPRTGSIKDSASTLPSRLPNIRLTPVMRRSPNTSDANELRCAIFHGIAGEGEPLLSIDLKCDGDPEKLQLKDVYAFLSTY